MSLSDRPHLSNRTQIYDDKMKEIYASHEMHIVIFQITKLLKQVHLCQDRSYMAACKMRLPKLMDGKSQIKSMCIE